MATSQVERRKQKSEGFLLEVPLPGGTFWTVTTDKIFDFVRDLRKEIIIPMVFMTYANVVFSYGAERFISTCKEIEIDGLILPELPYEEKEEFLDLCHKYDVDLISLIAPTSENRIAMIAREAEGFIYLVSSLGVTGTRTEIKTDLASIVKVIRKIHEGCSPLAAYIQKSFFQDIDDIDRQNSFYNLE